jgi:hypothetical protein
MEQARLAVAQKIQAEAPGNTLSDAVISKPEFHFWGYATSASPERRAARRLK